MPFQPKKPVDDKVVPMPKTPPPPVPDETVEEGMEGEGDVSPVDDILSQLEGMPPEELQELHSRIGEMLGSSKGKPAMPAMMDTEGMPTE